MASTTFNFTVGHNTGSVIVAGNITINWHTDGNTLWFDSGSLNSGYSWYNAQKLAIVVNVTLVELTSGLTTLHLTDSTQVSAG